MENSEVLKKVITMLDNFTTKVDNNVRFGNYPFIAYYDGHIKIFKFKHETAASSLTGWLLPVGIPFMVKNIDNKDDGGVVRDRARVVGYYLGNALYIHKEVFDKHVGGVDKKVFFMPTVEDFVYVTPGGWSVDEQKGFGKYLWQMATKAMSGDFREVANITFEPQMYINSEVLFKDGWVANKVAGRNIFYGIVQCPIEIYDIEVELGDKLIWYNKYLTILDVTGGNGVQTFGHVLYNGNYHPHVGLGGGLCRGNAARRIQDKLNAGMLTEFFIFMKDFLSSYSDENPFTHLPVTFEEGKHPVTGSKFIQDKIYCTVSRDG